MFIDLHCHIDLYKDEEIVGIVERARKAGVKTIINNGTEPEANRRTLYLSSKYPEIKTSMGIYPLDGLKMSEAEIFEEILFIKKNKSKIVAIGEVGLDKKEINEKDFEKQKENFQKMMALARELKKPIIVHSRKAELETIEMLEKSKHDKIVMHCFSGKLNLVKRIIDNGWYLTIPTSVTRLEHFQKVIEIVPMEKLFCETDSPWMNPNGGMQNEPALVIESYKKIAQIKKISLKEVEKQIEDNYKRLF